MAYEKTNWENFPSTSTPLSASNLNHLETQYEEAVGEITPQLASKANLVSGKVPLLELPTSTSATSNTVPVRQAFGVIPGVGTPVASGDAVNKGHLDSRLNGVVSGGSGAGNLRFMGGALRRISSTEWGVISDAGHTSLGISGVTIVGGTYLRVEYDFTAAQVITFSVTIDDSFAGTSNVLKVGASVGLTSANIYMYFGYNSTTPTDPGTLSTPGGNLWVSGLFLV